MKQHLIPWRERNQKELKWLGIIVACMIILGIGGYFFYDLKETTKKIEKQEEKKSLLITDNLSSPTPEIVLKNNWMVDIKGEVQNPGTYAVDDSMRVIDVIHLAGELTENADTSVLNLSQKVKDQMVIIIYSKKEVINMKETIEKQKELALACKQEDFLKNEACLETEESEKPTNQKVNINKANLEELMSLPGIGESKAKEILNYREQNGPFQKIEDLTNVSGIGDSTFESIKSQITITE